MTELQKGYAEFFKHLATIAGVTLAIVVTLTQDWRWRASFNELGLGILLLLLSLVSAVFGHWHVLADLPSDDHIRKDGEIKVCMTLTSGGFIAAMLIIAINASEIFSPARPVQPVGQPAPAPKSTRKSNSLTTSPPGRESSR